MKSVLRFLFAMLLLAPLSVPLAQAQVRLGGSGSGVVALAVPLVTPAASPSPAPGTVALTVFPNPVVDEATVRFTLDRSQRVILDVFDLLGRRVRGHDLGVLAAGEHERALDLRGLPPGLYIVRLTGDAGAQATVRVTRLPSA